MKIKGLTLLEVLVGLVIFSLLISISVFGFRGILNRVEIDTALRRVIVCLNTARYLSIKNNKRIRLNLINNRRLLLSLYRTSEWRVLKEANFPKRVSLSLSTLPYFYPNGYIVPLFSIIVENNAYRYQISASFAGRFKIKQLWRYY